MRKKDQHRRCSSSEEPEPVNFKIVFTEDEDSDDESPKLENEIDDLEDESSDSPKSKPYHHTRSNHNELEKNRRAQLKIFLNKLKDLVPVGSSSVTKQTTIGLLMKSKRFIRILEDRERKHLAFKDQLQREQKCLKMKLEQLQQSSNGGTTCSGQMTPTLGNSGGSSCTSNLVRSSNLPHILKRKVHESASRANRIPESGCLASDDLYSNGTPCSPHGITVLREVYTPANYSHERICFIIDDMEYSSGVDYDTSPDPGDGSSNESSSSLEGR